MKKILLTLLLATLLLACEPPKHENYDGLIVRDHYGRIFRLKGKGQLYELMPVDSTYQLLFSTNGTLKH